MSVLRTLCQSWRSPSSGWFDRQIEDIADAALGPDDTWRAGIDFQLAAQPQDLHVDAAIEHILVNPGRLQQVRAGEWPLRGIQKRDEQGIFSLRQRDQRAIWIGQSPARRIELPAAEPAAAARWVFRRGRTPPQHGAHAGQQFAKSERFCDVVIGAKLQPNHALDLVGSMPRDDDPWY